MKSNAKLLWIVAVCAAATFGLAAGIWIGGEIEADIHDEILAKAELPVECWKKIEAAANALVLEYSGE